MKTFVLCFSVLLFTLAARADNVSGKWIIETPGRGGQMQRTTLVLNQTGQLVTGTVSAGNNPGTASPVHTDIYDGKVDGDTISFYVWRGSDQPWKENYKGTLAGDTISFTITSDRQASTQAAPGRSTGPVQATARRSQ